MSLLFQNSQQSLTLQQQQAQAKVAQLNHQLELVAKECDRHNPRLRSLKQKLQAEQQRLMAELQQGASTQASVHRGLSAFLHHTGVPP